MKFFGGMTLVVLALAIFVPTACGCKVASKGTACLSNLKQQALGEIVYAADHDDRFTTHRLWMDGIAPYVKLEGVFHDPEVPKGVYGYAFNAALSRAEAPVRPEKVPMVYDSVNPIRNASDFVTSFPSPGRHTGRDDIGHADGHAKSVPMR